MTDDTGHVDAIDEELVAYLDGELEAVDRARVERRLADDATYRDRLRTLQQAWDALDLLPKASAGEAFTSTTVGLVVMQEERAATQAVRTLVAHRSRRWLGVTAIAVAAIVAGFLASYRRLTPEDRALVRDLPVIQQVDPLHNTPSLDFLEQLRSAELFQADSDAN